VADTGGNNWLVTIVSNGRWYMLSSILTKVMALGTMTILTHNLSPAEFGAVNAVVATTQVLPILMSLYLEAALARLYHEYEGRSDQQAALLSSTCLFVVIWGGVTLLASFAVFAAGGLGMAMLPMSAFWLAAAPVLLQQLAQFGLVYLRQSFQAWHVASTEMLAAFIGLAATYVLVAGAGLGLSGRLWAIAVSSVYMFAAMAWHFHRRGLLRLQVDRALLAQGLGYSLPLLPNLAAGWIAGVADRLIIARYASLEAVGIYALAASIAQLIYIIQDAVTQVTGVQTQAGMARDRTGTLHMLTELSIVMWLVMLFVAYCAAACALPVIRLFAGSGYDMAAPLVGILGFIYVLAPQSRLLQDLIGFNKRTWVISSGAVLMAACSLGLNLLLVPSLGYVAAAYVFVMATLIQTAWLYAWVRRSEPLQLRWGQMALAVALYVGCMVVDYCGLLTWPAKIALTAAYGVVTWLLVAPAIRRLRTGQGA